MVASTSRVVKMKEHLVFCREFSILCVEDGGVVDRLSNFQREQNRKSMKNMRIVLKRGFSLGELKYQYLRWVRTETSVIQKSSSYFQNNFLILSLCDISSTLVFKVRDVLH